MPKLSWDKLVIKSVYGEDAMKSFYEEGRVVQILHPIDPKVAKDMGILRSWISDYKKWKSPYVVVLVKGKLVLLKERKV